MGRLLALAAALVALCVPARAQPPFVPCPFVQAGWSQQYAGNPITSVQYDQDAQILYVIFGGTTPSAFSNVPFTVMQAFIQTTNPMAVYESYVLPVYHALFLFQTNNCPMLLQIGTTVPLQYENSVNPIYNEALTSVLDNENQTITEQGYLWTK